MILYVNGNIYMWITTVSNTDWKKGKTSIIFSGFLWPWHQNFVSITGMYNNNVTSEWKFFILGGKRIIAESYLHFLKIKI